MKIFTRPLRLLSAAAIALAFMVPNARAAAIFIDAANLDEQVAFNFGQFEGGFSINGSTPITTGGAVFGEGTQLNFTGQWIDLGAAVSFARTVYWVDAVTPTVISDILQWAITPSGPSGLATISGFFKAFDDDGGPVPGGTPSGDIIVEQANGSHDPFNFSAAFLGGQVITGASIDDHVPEPTTLALMGLGLAGIGYRRQRSRKGA